MTTQPTAAQVPESYDPAKDDAKLQAMVNEPSESYGVPSRWIRCMAAEILALRSSGTAEAKRLDYIEDRLRTTGEVFFVRAFDGDMQMNTADCVGVESGGTLRDLIDAEMKESERG